MKKKKQLVEFSCRGEEKSGGKDSLLEEEIPSRAILHCALPSPSREDVPSQ